MVTDFRLAISFRDNKKRVRLQRVLGAEGVLALIDLWGYAAENKPDGILSGMDDEDICIAAQWTGETEKFVSSLADDRIKFLEFDLTLGCYVLHDWEDHNPWATGSKRRSDAAKVGARSRWDKEKNADRIKPHCGSHETALPIAENRNAPSPSPSPSPYPNQKEKKNLCRVESEKPDSSLFDDFDRPDSPADGKILPQGKKISPSEENFEARFEWIWKRWPSSRRTTKKEVSKALRIALKRASWDVISTGAKTYVRSAYVESRVEMGETSSIKTLPAWLNANRWEIPADAIGEPCRAWSEKNKNEGFGNDSEGEHSQEVLDCIRDMYLAEPDRDARIDAELARIKHERALPREEREKLAIERLKSVTLLPSEYG